MQVTKCKKCGYEIGMKTDRCANCGEPVGLQVGGGMIRKVLLIIAVIYLIRLAIRFLGH